MSAQVVVVGSFVQDLTWKCAAFPCAGETVIGTFVTGPGGKGSNQAIAAGRAGARTLFVGAVGADVFAAGAKQFYAAEGIAAHFVEKPAHATGTAAILVNAAGQNEIVVALGASSALRPDDVPVAALRDATVVLTQHETDLRTVATVLKTARRAGVLTVHNPAPMRPDFAPVLLRHVDILIPNESEFAALVNLLAPKTAAGAKARRFRVADLHALPPDALHTLCRTVGVPTVIVTLGARGIFISQPTGHVFIAAHKVKVVDTTGAGDAFCGGFAAGLVKFSGDVVAAARLGNAVAALSVTKFGTAPSMPTQREIAAFLGKI
jgi:ribokinase